MKHLLLSSLLAVALIGCGNPEPDMEAAATYDSFGASISAENAVPLQAVAAEIGSYLNTEVKIEGMVTEVCQMSGCWLTVQAPNGPAFRVDVPRDSEGAYVYTFPMDISGRRVVLAGLLTGGDDAAHEHGDHDGDGDESGMDEDAEHEMDQDGDESHSDAEAAAMTAKYALTATGALVERVRS